jgi:hypothetical protein
MERRKVPNSSMRISAKKELLISILVFTFILMSTHVLIPRLTPMGTVILMGL